MCDKKYTIYCHRNKVNGFEYIGMTGRDVNIRWQGKKRAYDMCTNFRNALDEYGWNGFEHLVLVSGLTKDEAIRKETELIRENIEKGISYNIREDNDWLGNLRKKKVDVYDLFGNLVDVCDSIHDASMRYNTAETHAYYCACGRKKTVHNKYIFAFHGSDIQERLAEANIDRRYNTPAHNRRKVKMISLSGDVVRVFDSVTEASSVLNRSVGNIVSVCTGRHKTCGGYKWEYV